MRKKPGFVGIIGDNIPPDAEAPYAGLRRLWSLTGLTMRIWTYGDHSELAIAAHDPGARPNRPAALVLGSPFLASDLQYGPDSRVRRINPGDGPDAATKAYEDHGTAGFGLLDGEFSLVIADQAQSGVYLVVDKFGCSEVFVRRMGSAVCFSSDCDLLMEPALSWDPLAVTFFLAQHGFVPGPCTLAAEIESVARAGFLHIFRNHDGVQVERGRYWRPRAAWQLSSTGAAVDRFFEVIGSATQGRTSDKTALLLSAGVDSSLLLNIIRRSIGPGQPAPLTLTGAIRGSVEGEHEIRRAAGLAGAMNVEHAAVVIDPADESLPDEWALCTTSMTGARITMPLFRRFGAHMRARVGEGYNVLSGQMADTLADNNYTLPSAGYTFRRAFCSPWFLSTMPILRWLAPRQGGFIGRRLVDVVRHAAGPRAGGMIDSVLDGISGTRHFYDGRLFGYGEMPGRAPEYFSSVRRTRFNDVAEWYSQRFIAPALSDLTPATFYRNMIELSMDMVMLHLDTRTVFQVFRTEAGSALLPFLDARVVNFFCSLPYWARAFYRKPKLIIHRQFKRQNLLRNNSSMVASSGPSVERLLLGGSLGACFRELIGRRTLPDRVPGLFEFIDERYFNDQVRSFCTGAATADDVFISKLAALELWSQTMARRDWSSVLERCLSVAI